MRRLAVLVLATAALALPALALAAPASAEERRCYTVYVNGFHTVESCLPLPDLELG